MTKNILSFNRVGATSNNQAGVVRLVLYVAAVLFVVTGAAWWHYVYNSQSHVFWGMVDNTMNTSAFSRSSNQDNTTQQITQTTQAQTAGTYLVNSRVLVQQPTATITTESVGTPYVDYVRYTGIDITGGTTAAKPDLSKVLNVWGKSSAEVSSTGGQLYNEAAVGYILFGKITGSERGTLVRQLRDSKAYDPTLVSVERHGLRRTYVYDVNVNLAAYAAVLKDFAHSIGLTQYEGIDPTQYKASPDQKITMKVDNWSHQLTELSYAGSTVRTETLASYGDVRALAKAPKDAITFDELQYRLQALQ